MLQMNAHDLNRFLDDAFGANRSYVVDDVNDQRLIARVRADAVTLRPGGTISGPTLMALADGAAYCQILAHIGPVALAVTSSLSISFLRKPEAGVELVAQAVVTYAIPSAR
jgi:acyl-coenzyme A thioesterase PaaI-like protein